MPEWLSAATPWGILINVLVPVLIFVAVAVLARLAYQRYALSTAPVRVSHSQPGERLEGLENLVRRYYKAQGYEVLHSGTDSNLLVIKDDVQTLVRCWSGAEPLGAEAVEAAAQLRSDGVQRVVLIAPQGFSEAALQRAAALGVELRGQDHIDVMLNLMRRREAA
jgi:hypothetical protein